ncbi:MAG: RAMP superfamily CRISPR-associated protein [Bacillota bacterium]
MRGSRVDINRPDLPHCGTWRKSPRPCSESGVVSLNQSGSEVRFRATVRVECHSPILVQGAGLPKGTADLLFFERDRRAVIPGSSLRGAWRHALERLLRQLGQPVCYPPRPESMCPHVDLGRGTTGEFCMACKVFGSPWLASRLAVEDLYAEQEEPEGEELLRHGVAVDRISGAVSRGKLFITEVPHARAFTGSIRGELDSTQLGLLIAAARLITHLGGGRARGLGRVTVKIGDLCHSKGTPLGWNQEDLILEAVRRMGA